MKFRNLTPHMVCIANGNLKITIEKNPADPIVRIEESILRTMVDYEIAPGVKASIQLEDHTGYTVIGLPDPEPGVMYIVSSMVASRVKRTDVVSPITDATCERSPEGRVISVRGFQTYTPDYTKIATVTPEERPFITAIPVNEPTSEENKPEEIEEVLPPREFATAVSKVDEIALDPIKLAARMKYEKRMAKTKVNSRR